jgi:FtsH-binding integral membrane protein
MAKLSFHQAAQERGGVMGHIGQNIAAALVITAIVGIISAALAAGYVPVLSWDHWKEVSALCWAIVGTILMWISEHQSA